MTFYARGELTSSFLHSCTRKVWHYLAGEQPHRCLGLGTADHAEIHLQRGALEAANAAVIAVDGAPNLLRSSDPSEAFFDLRLERLAREAFDHLLVVGVVARGHAGQPAGVRIYDRFEVLIERLARDGGGLRRRLRAVHVEREHDLAAAGMPRRRPGI